MSSPSREAVEAALDALRERGFLADADLAELFGATRRLIVYGSLAPGAVHHDVVADLRGSWREGWVTGELVRSGWGAGIGYPALRWEPEGARVPAHLLESDELVASWGRLDEFEGAGYRRVPAPFHEEGGGFSVGYVYVRREEVTLEEVSLERDRGRLRSWLERPHVARWWGDAERALACVREHALIAVEGRPVGYLRWQTAERAELDAAGLADVPEGSVDVDVFIGEPAWLGRGVGSRALRLLLHRLAREGRGPLVGLTTSVANARAIRAFEKAGFRKLRRVADPTYGPCWVLVADLAGGA